MTGRLAGKVAIVTGAGGTAVTGVEGTAVTGAGGTAVAGAEGTAVTGAEGTAGGVGNGHAAAVRLAAEGAAVVCVDLDAERAAVVVDAITADGGTATAYVGDVSDPAACAGMVACAVGTYGGLHVLVNNVGIGSRQALPDIDLDSWNRVLAVNVTSAMLASQAAAPAMRAAGGGSIVTVGSVIGHRWSSPGSTAYTTSKAALAGLTVSLAGQLAPDAIRANLLVVGFVWSPLIAAAAARMPAEWREQRRRSGLLETEGSPWHVADAVLFLAGDESCWITGQSIAVDGGASVTTR